MLQAAQLADDFIRLEPGINVRGTQFAVQIVYNVNLAIMIKINEDGGL